MIRIFLWKAIKCNKWPLVRRPYSCDSSSALPTATQRLLLWVSWVLVYVCLIVMLTGTFTPKPKPGLNEEDLHVSHNIWKPRVREENQLTKPWCPTVYTELGSISQKAKSVQQSDGFQIFKKKSQGSLTPVHRMRSGFLIS